MRRRAVGGAEGVALRGRSLRRARSADAGNHIPNFAPSSDARASGDPKWKSVGGGWSVWTGLAPDAMARVAAELADCLGSPLSKGGAGGGEGWWCVIAADAEDPPEMNARAASGRPSGAASV